MSDIIENASGGSQRDGSLRTIGHISYALHAIVAIGAVLPGAQPGVLLLLVAFVLDLVKKDDARGTWQESHFRWRIRSVLWAGAAKVAVVALTPAAVVTAMATAAVASATAEPRAIMRVRRMWI